MSTSHLIKRGSRVKINRGVNKDRVGWVTDIEVDHSGTFYAIVWLTIQLAKPYGLAVTATSAMVDLQYQESTAFYAA